MFILFNLFIYFYFLCVYFKINVLLILTKIKNNKLTKLSPVKEEILVNDPPKKKKKEENQNDIYLASVYFFSIF